VLRRDGDAIGALVPVVGTDRRRKQAEIDPWESLVSIASVAFVVLALVTVLLVYFLTVFGANSAVVVARFGGLACIAAIATVTLGLAGSAWIRRTRGAAAAMTAVTLLLAGTTATGTFVLVTQLKRRGPQSRRLLGHGQLIPAPSPFRVGVIGARHFTSTSRISMIPLPMCRNRRRGFDLLMRRPKAFNSEQERSS
jgi:hypothetical protein